MLNVKYDKNNLIFLFQFSKELFRIPHFCYFCYLFYLYIIIYNLLFCLFN